MGASLLVGDFSNVEVAWELVRNSWCRFPSIDGRAYIDVLAEQGERFGVMYLAWCLMSNHIHLIAGPSRQGSGLYF